MRRRLTTGAVADLVAGAMMLALGTAVVPSATALGTPPPPSLVFPIDGFSERQTIKQFGTFVDRAFLDRRPDLFQDNGYPKFTGYHAAVDVEYAALPEQSSNTEVRAMAAGTVIYKASVTGYGGVIVVRHQQPEPVTSLYGHVRLSDSPVQVGQAVTAGQPIANLGTPYGPETGGERKHLHFGIRRGTALDLNGHEPNQTVLRNEWYDPNVWLRDRGAVGRETAARPPVTPSPSPTQVPNPMPSPAVSPAPEPERGFFGKLWEALTGWLRD